MQDERPSELETSEIEKSELETQEFKLIDILLDESTFLEEQTQPSKPVEFIDEETYKEFARNVYNLETVEDLNLTTFLDALVNHFKVSEGMIGSYLIMYIMACAQGVFRNGFDFISFQNYYKKKNTELIQMYDYQNNMGKGRHIPAAVFLENEYKCLVEQNQALSDELSQYMDEIIYYLWAGFRYMSDNLSEQ